MVEKTSEEQNKVKRMTFPWAGADLRDPTHRARQNHMDRSMLCSRLLVNLISQEHSCQKEKRVTEDEMVGWHHQFNWHELGQTLGDGEGQGRLLCCHPWGCKESDMTGGLNNNKIETSRILVPWPGIEPMPPALGAWSLNHWTTREVPFPNFKLFILYWGIAD